MREIRLTVPGIPRPQGSKRHVGRGIMVESSKLLGPWRERVALAAQASMEGREPIEGPVHLAARFYFQRPRAHFGSGRNSDKLKPSAAEHPQGRPDLSKLVRAVEDSLSGIVFRDDAQIVSLAGTCKLYGTPPRAELVVSPA